MTTFYLQTAPCLGLGLRVYLAPEAPSNKDGNNLVRTIEADTWFKARLTVNDYEFVYKDGYGYGAP